MYNLNQNEVDFGAEADVYQGAGHCPICANFLSGSYYRVEGRTACAVCAIQTRARHTEQVMFVRNLVLATGALILCQALPSLVRQTPLQGAIGFVALFAGVLIVWQLSAGKRLHLDGPHSAS
jgi:hypothetical protein